MIALFVALGWLVVAAPAAVAAGPATFGNSAAIDIPAAGSANQEGPASPYPSPITVSGMTGLVTNVTVTFNNLSHTSVNDIDAMVVAPSGEDLIVMSDIGDPGADPNTQGVMADDVDLTFSDSAATSVPRVLHLGTGTYKPTNTNSGDTFPQPAPGPSSQTTLAGAFTGIDPNGTWTLYVVDDNSGDTGTMAGGWSLTITTAVATVSTKTVVTTSGTPSTTNDQVTFTATVTAGTDPVTSGTVQFSDGTTDLGSPVAVSSAGKASSTTSALPEGTHQIRATYSGATGFLASNGTVTQRVDNPTVVTGNTFCNTGPLTIPSVGTAQPYPSNITVSGVSGDIIKVTATLKGLSHQSPGDLDVLLSGPTPSQNLFLLSDSGGHDPITNETVTFDDAAATGVPDPLISGTFRPTNSDDGSNDAMASPAPTPSSATGLSTFDGGSANGQWSLWVVDDASADPGSISGGWCLTVAAPASTSTHVAASPSPSTFGAPVTLTATVTSGGSPVAAGTVQFSDGATPIGSDVPVAADGTAKLTISTLAVGTHTISATYSGTSELAGSSDTVDQVVDKAATTTTLASDLNPSVEGQSVTFTASVASRGNLVTTGTVAFTDGATALGTVPVQANGEASLLTTGLSVGTHTIKAAYSGTSSLAKSSDSSDQVVNPAQAQTSTVLVSGQNPSDLGQSVTFTATVSSNANPVTDGSVTFSVDGAAVPGSVAVDHVTGQATYTTSALTAGTHSIVAEYGGSSAYESSGSNTVDQIVQLVADAGGPYTVAEGDSVTLDASGSTPGMTYAWDVNGDGDFGDATGISPTLSWADLEALGINNGPSTYDVTLRVSDNTQTVDSAPTVLTVDNTAPTAWISGDLAATVGVASTGKVGADDPSSADMAAEFTYVIDWGDGSPVETVIGPADPPVTHIYTDPGTVIFSVTAADQDGAQGAPSSMQFQVAPAATQSPTPSSTPTAAPSSPADTSPTPPSTSSSSSTPTAAPTSSIGSGSEPTSSPGNGLPGTGSDVSPGLIVLAAVLLAAGAALLLWSRRRNSAPGRHS